MEWFINKRNNVLGVFGVLLDPGPGPGLGPKLVQGPDPGPGAASKSAYLVVNDLFISKSIILGYFGYFGFGVNLESYKNPTSCSLGPVNVYIYIYI